MFECVIFIHNDIEARNIVYEALASRGYKIITIPAYNDVWKILNKLRPNYIFLDAGSCETPAEALALKMKGIDENIKVIILNGQEKRTPRMFVDNIFRELNEKPAADNTPKMQFKANVLVVDDEKECVEIVKDCLIKKGLNVESAFSGEEALLKVNASRPDIILLDIYMPGIDGLIVLKNVKDIDKSIIVIMTTSIEDQKVISQAKDIGADGYLVKPFSLRELEKTIVESTMKKYAA